MMAYSKEVAEKLIAEFEAAVDNFAWEQMNGVDGPDMDKAIHDLNAARAILLAALTT